MSGLFSAEASTDRRREATGAVPGRPEEPEGWEMHDFDQPPVELGLAAAILLVLAVLSPLF